MTYKCGVCGKVFDSYHAHNGHKANCKDSREGEITEDMLKNLYIDKKMTIPEIAEKLNFNNAVIYRKMEKFDIPRRTHPKWKGGKVEMECNWCGEKIMVWPHEVDEGNHFCSRKCFAKFFSENYSGENAPDWKGGSVKLECVVCGNTFEVHPKAADHRKCCSPECGSKYLSGENHPFYNEKRPEHSERMKGENNPNYGGAPHLEGESNPGYGRVDYPKPYFVEELDHKVRSSWEEKIGLLLENNNIDYLGYEAKTFEFNGTTYTPDYIISENIIVEVKGPLYDYHIKKYQQFMQEFPEVTFIIVGDAGDEPDEICDIHVPWREREKLVPVLKNLLEKKDE